MTPFDVGELQGAVTLSLTGLHDLALLVVSIIAVVVVVTLADLLLAAWRD